MRGIDQLEGHLETSATFVPANLHPDLLSWDDSIMPCKPLDTEKDRQVMLVDNLVYQ